MAVAAETVSRVSAQTLDRGLQILEVIARASGPVTIADAAVAIGVHRTVAHRLVTTLADRGYLHREAAGGYRLGGTCLALASAVSDLRTTARPLLEDLARRTDETVHLVVLAGQDVVFLDSVESSQALRVASRIGRRLPAYATSVGKAWLASLDLDRLHQLYPDATLPPITGRTLTTRTELERVLATVRRRGYATNEGESEAGVGSLGVVVRTERAEPRAGISVAMPLDRLNVATKKSVVAALTATAASLGARLS